MKKKNINKILIIISIIIICIGIILGFEVSHDLEKTSTNENIYIDSSDFSGLAQIGGMMVSKLLGILMVIYSIFIDVLIWVMYGIVLIIKKLIRKINIKNTL